MFNEMQWLAQDRQERLMREVEQVRLQRAAARASSGNARAALRRAARLLDRGQLGPARESDWRAFSPRPGRAVAPTR